MIITLCGYMGAGKTTIGKKLAKKLNYDFLDLDEYLEKKYAKKIIDIFAELGEEYFRKIETAELKELVKKDKIVLSLGGGAVLKDENKTILKSTFVVYLQANFDDCYERIKNSDRPIVKSKSKEQLKLHFDKRICHYENVANLIVETTKIGTTVNYICNAIKEI